MKILKVKCDKTNINYINKLLQEINFEDKSKEMKSTIKKLNAKKNDYIGLFSIDLDDKHNITIDVLSGDINYYDNVVIWEKSENIRGYNEVTYLDCEFEIGKDIILEKDYFDFLNEDYTIKFIY